MPLTLILTPILAPTLILTGGNFLRRRLSGHHLSETTKTFLTTKIHGSTFGIFSEEIIDVDLTQKDDILMVGVIMFVLYLRVFPYKAL